MVEKVPYKIEFRFLSRRSKTSCIDQMRTLEKYVCTAAAKKTDASQSVAQTRLDKTRHWKSSPTVSPPLGSKQHTEEGKLLHTALGMNGRRVARLGRPHCNFREGGALHRVKEAHYLNGGTSMRVLYMEDKVHHNC